MCVCVWGGILVIIIIIITKKKNIYINICNEYLQSYINYKEKKTCEVHSSEKQNKSALDSSPLSTICDYAEAINDWTICVWLH